MRCSHCGGTIYPDRDGDLVCYNCGRRKYRQTVDISKPKKSDRLVTMLPGLPDTFRLVDLLRQLWRTDERGWTPAKLAAALAQKGYATLQPANGGSLLCRKLTYQAD
jgi:hypothetical protein